MNVDYTTTIRQIDGGDGETFGIVETEIRDGNRLRILGTVYRPGENTTFAGATVTVDSETVRASRSDETGRAAISFADPHLIIHMSTGLFDKLVEAVTKLGN